MIWISPRLIIKINLGDFYIILIYIGKKFSIECPTFLNEK